LAPQLTLFLEDSPLGFEVFFKILRGMKTAASEEEGFKTGSGAKNGS